MKYIRTVVVGLLGFFALWALWGSVMLWLGLEHLGMRAYVAAILAIATAFMGLVGVELSSDTSDGGQP